MKILITGSSGMLGSALCEELSKDPAYKIVGLDTAERPLVKLDTSIQCDITDYTALSRAVKNTRPDLIIHTAAFTDVDGCECEPDKAETVNGVGTRYIAEAALESGAAVMYISTDFVFDGRKEAPYKEDDTPNPLNVYGRSKLDGERFLQEIIKGGDFFIIRSSWLFGPNGKNFVDTILTKAQNEKVIKVVSDQFGSPTYATDLARGIIEMLDLYQSKRHPCGIYHITNSDDCSWYKLAQRSLELANIYGVELVPIISTELGRPAERPLWSVLDNARFIAATGRPLRPWYKALEEYITRWRRG